MLLTACLAQRVQPFCIGSGVGQRRIGCLLDCSLPCVPCALDKVVLTRFKQVFVDARNNFSTTKLCDFISGIKTLVVVLVSINRDT